MKSESLNNVPTTFMFSNDLTDCTVGDGSLPASPYDDLCVGILSQMCTSPASLPSKIWQNFFSKRLSRFFTASSITLSKQVIQGPDARIMTRPSTTVVDRPLPTRHPLWAAPLDVGLWLFLIGLGGSLGGLYVLAFTEVKKLGKQRDETSKYSSNFQFTEPACQLSGSNIVTRNG